MAWRADLTIPVAMSPGNPALGMLALAWRNTVQTKEAVLIPLAHTSSTSTTPGTARMADAICGETR